MPDLVQKDLPSGKSLWVRATGAWHAAMVRPSLPQARPSSDRYTEVISFPEGCGAVDSWQRPLTPTLLGYEVMEERSKFTVYKILVRRNKEENWVIFRRYTYFSRLNDKLKEIFPRLSLALPPKCWFGDNYNIEFLEERQLGLQAFLQNLTAHEDVTNSEVVRQFLCLDEPPGAFDSLEESRVFCETLEETNHSLQRELSDKQCQIDALKMALDERQTHIEVLEKRLSPEGMTVEHRRILSALQRENRAHTDLTAHRDTEADNRLSSSTTKTDRETRPERRSDFQPPFKGHGVYWSYVVNHSSPGGVMNSTTS